MERVENSRKNYDKMEYIGGVTGRPSKGSDSKKILIDGIIARDHNQEYDD